jgi:arylsulfatase A-like enzyme
MDILPTVAAAVGAQLPPGRTYDGKNLLPYLTGKTPGPIHEWLFWDGDEGRRAVRHLRWKLVDNNGKVQLFDLEADVSEKNDISAKHPEMVQRLRAALEEWRKKNAPRIRPRPGAPDEDEMDAPRQRKKERKKK